MRENDMFGKMLAGVEAYAHTPSTVNTATTNAIVLRWRKPRLEIRNMC